VPFGAFIVGDVSVPALTGNEMNRHAALAKSSFSSRSAVRSVVRLVVRVQFMFPGSGQPNSGSPVEGNRELPHKEDGVLFGLKGLVLLLLLYMGGPVAPNTAL